MPTIKELRFSLTGKKTMSDELTAAQSDQVRTMAHHGQLISDICYAAFGHRDALTEEQIALKTRINEHEAETLKLVADAGKGRSNHDSR